MATGFLQVQTTTANGAIPVDNASITVADNSNQTLYQFTTDEIGQAPAVELEAPPRPVIADPFAPNPPWQTYKVWVQAQGYTTMAYEGVMISDRSTSFLKIILTPVVLGHEEDVIHLDIEGHKLYQTTAPQQVQDQPTNDGFIGIVPTLLPEVTIPNNIRVQLGRMEDTPNIVSVPFIEYIKNVAANEIYDYWEEEAMIANIYCIVSLTLNRVYTEFYRKKGYNFDITSETNMDQKYVHGGATKPPINRVIERIFNNYLAIIGHKEPFLSLYNDGIKVNIPGRLSQHGSQADAQRGMNAWQIIKKYYSQNLELRVCENFGGILESYPGYTLRQGDRGEAVRTMQRFLNRILGLHIPNFNAIIQDGVFGATTRSAVITMQGVLNLPQTGEIDRITWYEISKRYATERRLWEMDSEGQRIGIGTTPPTQVIRLGHISPLVVELQFLLDFIALYHREIPFVAQTSLFDARTEEGVKAFQRKFGLTPDGVVGALTWRMLYDVYWGIMYNAEIPEPDPEINPDVPQFPGVALRVGSSGPNVLQVQRAINRVAEVVPGLWRIAEDSQFGNGTRDAVMAFQRIFGLVVDGVVGVNTWNRLMQEAYRTGGGGGTTPEIPVFPGTSLRVGDRGPDVLLIQQAINRLAQVHQGLWRITEDSIFGNGTRDAVIQFQRLFGLTADGIVGPNTWTRLMEEAANVSGGGGGGTQIPQFPGNLQVGSSGANVRTVQEAINTIAPCHPGRLWVLTIDGNFGNMTRDAIFSFQSVFGMPITGVVNQATWDRLMQEAANVSANGCGRSAFESIITPTPYTPQYEPPPQHSSLKPIVSALLLKLLMKNRYR